MSDHGYTSHGHSLPGKTQHPENRPPIARCGGPIICSQCRSEVKEAMKEMFNPKPTEDQPAHQAANHNEFPDIEIQCDQMIHTNGQRTRCDNQATQQVHLQHGFATETGTCEKVVILLCDDHVWDITMDLHGKRSIHWILKHATCGECGQEIDLDDIGWIGPLATT